jgi:imidazolonepropionase-like amidohydrolase
MGFTTLRGCGDVGWLDVAIRDAVASGIVEGPRVLASGQFLSPTGGHWDFLPEWLDRRDVVTNVADGVEGVRKAVRRQIKMKVNWVKYCGTGGIMNAYEKTFNFAEDELDALVTEAHEKGVLVAAHCIHHKGTLDAVKAGVDSIEHGIMLTDEIIDLMLEKETFLVPTLYAPCAIVERGSEFGLPEAYIEKCRPIKDIHIKSFQKALEAGVNIAFGTDAGMTSVVHGSSAYELELLVKYGMTPIGALKTATQSSAGCVRRSDSLGTLEKGKLADVVVVDGDPLEDIRILQDKERISLILKEGKIYSDRRPTNQ